MKVCRQVLVSVFSGLFIFVLTALPLRAAEGDSQDPVASTMGVFFRWLNFAIVFGGIVYLVSKYGGAFFRDNAKAIAADISKASEAKAKADAELHEVESKISHLPQDVELLREEAEVETKVETARLRESTQIEVEKIKQAAQVELLAAERAARQELRGVAATVAVERAGVEVKSRMTPEIRARLFRTFLGEIGGSKN
jgi:F0F1-type ATP synthase membrane subunit b/b'